MTDLTNWIACPRPERKVLDGNFCRLEPFNAAQHGDDLFAAATAADADDRFHWLPELTPENRAAFQPWLEKAEASEDPLFFAVIDKRTNTVEGRQTLMRIDEANGFLRLDVRDAAGLASKLGEDKQEKTAHQRGHEDHMIRCEFQICVHGYLKCFAGRCQSLLLVAPR